MLTSVCMPLQKLKFISALWISAGWALFLRPGSGLESCWGCHSLLALSTSGSCSLGLLPPGTMLCSVRLHALSKAWAYTFPGSFPGFQNSVVIPGTWVNNTLQDWVQRQQQCRDMTAQINCHDFAMPNQAHHPNPPPSQGGTQTLAGARLQTGWSFFSWRSQECRLLSQP